MSTEMGADFLGDEWKVRSFVTIICHGLYMCMSDMHKASSRSSSHMHSIHEGEAYTDADDKSSFVFYILSIYRGMLSEFLVAMTSRDSQ